MSSLHLIGDAARRQEATQGAREFAMLGKAILASRGNIAEAAEKAAKNSRDSNLGPRLAGIMRSGGGGISRETLQRAAVTAGTLSSFSDYSVIAQGFVNSLANFSAFDGMLSAMVPLPVGTGTAGQVQTGATAYSVGEGSAKQITRLTIASQQVDPVKCHAIVLVTAELARSTILAATQLLQRELQMATAVCTDAQFIAAITSGLSTATSVGANTGRERSLRPLQSASGGDHRTGKQAVHYHDASGREDVVDAGHYRHGRRARVRPDDAARRKHLRHPGFD